MDSESRYVPSSPLSSSTKLPSQTDHTIDRLVRITIGSSAPSAICASVGAIIYITTFSNWLYDLYYVVIIPLPALYTISFLYVSLRLSSAWVCLILSNLQAISGFHSDSSTGSGSNSRYRSNSVPLTNTSFKRSTSRRPEFVRIAPFVLRVHWLIRLTECQRQHHHYN